MVTVLQELTVNLGVTIWAYERITEQSSTKWKDSDVNPTLLRGKYMPPCPQQTDKIKDYI